MLYVHKKSSKPIDHWTARRHGGANNLANPAIPGKYLVLFNVDIVQREGAYHYIFEFDTRESLEMTSLARLVSGQSSYPNDMDWNKWLGTDCTAISNAVREEILNLPSQEVHTDALITNVREVPMGCPLPNQDDWNHAAPPDDFLVSLDSG